MLELYTEYTHSPYWPTQARPKGNRLTWYVIRFITMLCALLHCDTIVLSHSFHFAHTTKIIWFRSVFIEFQTHFGGDCCCSCHRCQRRRYACCQTHLDSCFFFHSFLRHYMLLTIFIITGQQKIAHSKVWENAMFLFAFEEIKKNTSRTVWQKRFFLRIDTDTGKFVNALLLWVTSENMTRISTFDIFVQRGRELEKKGWLLYKCFSWSIFCSLISDIRCIKCKIKLTITLSFNQNVSLMIEWAETRKYQQINCE